MPDPSNDTSPALSGFSRGWEMVKHVVGNVAKGALKWGVIGGAVVLGIAAVGAGVLAVMGLPVTAALAVASMIPGLSTVLGWAAGAVMGKVAAVALVGAGVGAALGGAMGLAGGVSGAGQAADDAADELVANHERMQVRSERQQMLGMRMAQQRMAMAQQAQQLGLSNPNAVLPGTGHDRGVHA